MNKIKNVIYIMLMMIIIVAVIFGINTLVVAKQQGAFDKSNIKNYKIGDIVEINDDVFYRDALYCVEHNQYLPQNLTKYTFVSKITIIGNQSTDSTGKKITNKANARLVGILTGTDKNNRDEMRNAIWNYMYTWVNVVGQRHDGLSKGFASTVKGDHKTDLEDDAKDYADTIAEEYKITDHTDKNKLTTGVVSIGDKVYTRIGPFNFEFSGEMSQITVKNQNNQDISGIKFGVYNGKQIKSKNVSDIRSKQNFYIAIPSDSGTNKISSINVKSNVKLKKADIWFFESSLGANQNLIYFEPGESTNELDKNFEYDITLEGNLKVIKVDADNNEVKLKNVSFYIQNKDTKKYVKQDENKNTSYVDDRASATEFKTDENGEIYIENLLVGTYVAYETKNENYGYEIIKDGQAKQVIVDKTQELKIPNKKVYVKISGYVWEDKIDGKQSYKNNLFQNGTDDVNDILKEGITVRLKDKQGNTIKETKTDKDGAYLFKDVLVAQLSNYYVEFEYDGLTYESVDINLDKDKGSKSSELTDIRKDFNSKFAEIQGTGKTTGITLDSSGNKVNDLTYVKEENTYTSTFIKDSNKYIITSTTSAAGYDLSKQYAQGKDEIKNVNLGIREREMPDLAVIEDIQNAKVSVNGYEHTYQYAKRFENQGEYGDGFNVGVKFANKYGTMTYTRAIYKSDIEYKPEEANKELQVYITYKIQIMNQSTNIVGQVNSLINYYDARYTVQKVGTGIDDNGNITGELKHSELGNYNDKYKKLEINSNEKIQAQKAQNIYVQFKLNKDAVISVMNNNATLDNIVEINSYSSFDREGKIYAGIDVDSNPGNIIPEDTSTYEDDMDSAPSLKLELTNAREITGKVFLDETNSEILTAQIREGDGEYKDGEKGISGVEITLRNTNGDIVSKAETDTNGDFVIKEFIPGDYILTYTWGNETYTIQNYKGTIYKDKERANNLEWYKNTEHRYSDAIDDWELRKNIDNQTILGVGEGQTKINKMNSSTPKMKIGVEFTTNITDNNLEYELDGNGNVKKDENGYVIRKDSFLYRIKDIDFGIVERARQQLKLDKHVKTVKITLADGSVLIDAKVNEEGKFEGQIAGLTGGPQLGFVKAEIDNEILQRSNIEIGYEIVITNVGENDYVSENGDYYFYGKEQVGNNIGELVKIQIEEIKDYLDNSLVLKEDGANIWKIDSNDTTVQGRNAFVTETLNDKVLAPNENISLFMNTSKDLANQEEIEFNNLVVITKLKTTPGYTSNDEYGAILQTLQDEAETVTITTPTGDNQNYILPIMIGLSTLVILGAGIWLIKNKVLNK